MSINLLKRMESSVHSFLLTVRRIYEYLNATSQTIQAFMDGRASGALDEMRDLSGAAADFDDDDQNTDFFSVGKKVRIDLRDMFELNKQYGWSKFIVVVPSIAIREGVRKSFETMQDHFMEYYGKKARFFVYDSKNLAEIDNFSQSSDINVMIINIQAFNARGKDARRIRTELDDFGSRKPIDVIKANRPIVILDEPQKMGGTATQESLKEFNPLFCLNYSATHKQHHTLVYVLDALDTHKQIVDIMEGGKDAFEKRQLIYESWR